jgi:uncharacterized membrane protein
VVAWVIAFVAVLLFVIFVIQITYGDHRSGRDDQRDRLPRAFVRPSDEGDLL